MGTERQTIAKDANTYRAWHGHGTRAAIFLAAVQFSAGCDTSQATADDPTASEGAVVASEGGASGLDSTAAAGGETSSSPADAATPDAGMANAFVTRSGSQLMYKGEPFRFAGSNLWWVGLSQDADPYCGSGCSVVDGTHLPPHDEIDDAMDEAQTMGANVVRTFGVLSVGCQLCIEPSLGQFGNFDSIDYAIASAKKRNIHVQLALVDNYSYYTGGKFTYLSWRGIPADSVGSQFFTDPTVLRDFEQHIATVFNHVNPYTGLAYKDEPAIFAWETGNELAVYPNVWTYSTWTNAVAQYIKDTLGAKQLVIDGRYGIYSVNSTVDTASLQLASVDIESTHSYDDFRTPSEVATEARISHSYNKAFILGEYAWTGTSSWTLSQMLSSVETKGGVDGDMFWELLAVNVHHGDGFELHWPGDTPAMQTAAQELQAHAFVMCPMGAVCRQ